MFVISDSNWSLRTINFQAKKDRGHSYRVLLVWHQVGLLPNLDFESRVTRLGESFRPLGDCFLWVVFLKISEVAHIWGQLFPRKIVTYVPINFEKMCCATYILGHLITNSSGHTGRVKRGCRAKSVQASCMHVQNQIYWMNLNILEWFWRECLKVRVFEGAGAGLPDFSW
jgi:hypothetical protein